MFDWQVSEEGTPLPEAVAEPRRPAGGWRGWRVALALLGIVVLLVAGGLRWRLGEQREVMRADLMALLRREEQARQFGLRDELARFAVRDAPEAWLAGFVATAQRPEEARPVTLELDEVRWDTRGALVVISVDGRSEVRYYRLAGGTWRRAPIPAEAWGPERVLGTTGVEVRYRERDRDFARALVKDLPALREIGTVWPSASNPQEIEIVPAEFGGTILSVEGNRYALNSPQLLAQTTAASGDAQLRFTLARAVLADIARPSATVLRSAPRVRDALRVVVALRWALEPEAMNPLRTRWREALPAAWASPFFSGTQTREELDPWQPNGAEATALLAADALVEGYEGALVEAIVREAATASTWDQVFIPILARYTIEVDAEVAAYARGDEQEVARLRVQPYSTEFERAGGLARLVQGDTGEWLAEMEGRDAPVHLDTHTVNLFAHDGTPLPDSCLGVYQPVQVQGDWLTVGERLLATQISATAPEPPHPLWAVAAPPDTLAFVQRVTAEGVSEALLAVQPDGVLVPIMELEGPAALRAVSNPAGGPVRFLVEQVVPDCRQSWFFLYEPARGLVGRWLVVPTRTLPNPYGAHWNPSDQSLSLFFHTPPGTPAVAHLRVGEEADLVKLESRFPPSYQPLGWAADGSYLLALSLGRRELVRLEPDTWSVLGFPQVLAEFPTRLPLLSPDRRTLLYTGGNVGERLHHVDLTVLQETAVSGPVSLVWWSSSEQVNPAPILNTGDSTVAISITPFNLALSLTRLAQAPLAQVSGAVACSPDLAFVSMTGGRSPYSHVLFQVSSPGNSRTIAQGDEQLLPIACP